MGQDKEEPWAAQDEVKTPSKRARRERKDNRPEEIVDAAFEEFAANGYAGTRLEDVAARAKVSKACPISISRPRKSCSKLSFAASSRRCSTRCASGCSRRSYPAKLSQGAVFCRWSKKLVKSRRMHIVRLLIAEGHKHPELTAFYYDHVISKGRDTLQGFIDRGVERGEFKPTALRDFPMLIIAPALMAVVWRSLFERHVHLDTDALLKAHIDILLDAIRAPGRDPEGDGS